MTRLETVFALQKPLLNIFISAGYPVVDSLPKLAHNLFKSGIDVLEVGMPYSDPLADGPIIQHASTRAIENGIKISTIFEQIKEIRTTENKAPILLMGYFNQLLQVGVESFLKQCQEAGIDGLIIPDLPCNVYIEHYAILFQKYRVSVCFLITPQTSNQRVLELDEACSAFLYIVSDNSLTGTNMSGFSVSQLAYFQRIKELELKSPTMIGFGISSQKMVEDANYYANGAIIGSAYLEAVRKNEEVEFINQLVR